MSSEAWIDTVRVARDMGNGVADLLPRWARSLRDAPYSLVEAISFALTVSRWRENLESHEMPPRRIWLDGPALRDWFDRVKEDRRREMESGASDRNREIEDPVENQAARGLLVG